MIKSLTVVNYLDKKLKIPFGKNNKSGFIITSIKGLGPVKADINMNNRAISDGASYNSSRCQCRNIVIEMYFDENTGDTIEDIRQKSYEYFPLKKILQLIIETDNRICTTYGYVETNEPDIFSEKEGAQISILCPDSYFNSYSTIRINSRNGYKRVFEFPFSNEDIELPFMEFGNITNEFVNQFEYAGDVETGIELCIEFTSHIPSYTLDSNIVKFPTHLLIHHMSEISGRLPSYTTLDLGKLQDIDCYPQPGDVIKISTVKGCKSAVFFRKTGMNFLSKGVNVLNCLTVTNGWIELQRGINSLEVVWDCDMPIPFDMTFEVDVYYNDKYEGV